MPERAYYLLRGEGSAVLPPAMPEQRAGIAKVSVAPYLDRAGVVLATGPHEVREAQFHLWAEPLQRGIRYYLEEQLSSKLGYRIGGGPAAQRSWQRLVEIDIREFHGTSGGDGPALIVGDTVKLYGAYSGSVGREYDTNGNLLGGQYPNGGFDSCYDGATDGQPWHFRYNPEAAARWREAGKEMWMYHAVDPREPFMNTFIQWPAIHGRLLMWYAALHESPGWLYYLTNAWQTNDKVIERVGRGPHTNFNPVSWGHSNGDGCLLYPGADGPVSTIRLENLTDGIEDWELFARLRDRERAAGANEEATDLIARLVRAGDDRTEDPALLERTRREAARRLLDMQ